MQTATPHPTAWSALLSTLLLTACPNDMLDDATATLETLDSLSTPGTLSATVTSIGVFPGETTADVTGEDTDADTDSDMEEGNSTGPGIVPCDLFPVYVFTAPSMERPWIRALHAGCTVEEITAGAARWTLTNGDNDPPHVSPPGIAPGTLDLNPSPYPDSLDDSCVIVMWGLDNKAPIKWSVNLDGSPVVQSGFVMGAAPGHPAWLDGDVWRGAFLPGDKPTCLPVEI